MLDASSNARSFVSYRINISSDPDYARGHSHSLRRIEADMHLAFVLLTLVDSHGFLLVATHRSWHGVEALAQGSGERKTEVLHPQPSQHAPPTRSGAAACKESAVVNGHTRTCLANCLNRAARIDRTQSIFIPVQSRMPRAVREEAPSKGMSSLQLDKRVALGQRTELRGLQGLLPVCSCSLLLSASSTRSHGPMQSFTQ